MSATARFGRTRRNEIATRTNVFSVAGVPTDATTVTLTITDPMGATTAPSVTRVSTGTYTATAACTLAGVWLYEWSGTGTATDVVQGTFTVSTIDGTLYCTVEELKSRLGIPDTADDFEVTLAVQAACRNIDEITGRYLRGTGTRTYVPESVYRQPIDD